MNIENRSFEMFPRIVKANQKTKLKISPFFGLKFPEKTKIKVLYQSFDGVSPNDNVQDFEIKNNVLEIEKCFLEEGEHIITLIFHDDNDNQVDSCQFKIYSLEQDLFILRPFKGDLHIHSTGSDGKETPESIATMCRKAGFDFMALVDHDNYQSSIELIKTLDAIISDFKSFPGEEIFSRGDTKQHVVNLGGNSGVCEIVNSDVAKFKNEVLAIVETLSDVPEDLKMEIATSEWYFNKIKEVGGLAVLPHPYWVTERTGTRNLSEQLLSIILKRKKFDAIELISRAHHLMDVDANNLMVERYQEERLGGNDMPVLSVSDAHYCNDGELFKNYYTIIFTDSLDDVSNVISAIKNYKSVAVEAPNNERIRIHGHFRLVKYSSFLVREFYPLHDHLCEREGKLMWDLFVRRGWISKKTLRAGLKQLKGSVPKFIQRFFEEDK